MKATASHRAEKQPRTPDQKLPLTGQCAREPACYVRSRRSPGASKIKQTAQSKLAYFYAALMDQFCTALDTLLTLTACAEYRPSEAECFNSFTEVSRSNCNFELLGPIGSLHE